MAAFGAAGRLVGEEADRLETVSRNRVGGRLQRTGVVGAGDAVAAVAAAVEKALELHGGNPAIVGEPGLDPHQHRVAPAVRVKDFLSRQRDLDRATGDERKLGGNQLMGKDVALAAEASAVGRGDHADAAHRQLENLAQRAMHVMGRLRRGPERQLAVGRDLGQRRVLLHRKMGVAFEERGVLAHVRGGANRLVGIAELERHRLVHVAFSVNRFTLAGNRLFDRHHRRQRLELDLDQVECLVGDPFVGGRDRGDGIADIADLFSGQRLLILADREDAELDRQIIAGEHGQHARVRPSARRVHVDDASMRVRTAQDAPVDHARQRQVIGELGLPADLGKCIGLYQRLPDDRQFLCGWRHRASVPAREAASSTASKIFR